MPNLYRRSQKSREGASEGASEGSRRKHARIGELGKTVLGEDKVCKVGRSRERETDSRQTQAPLIRGCLLESVSRVSLASGDFRDLRDLDDLRKTGGCVSLKTCSPWLTIRLGTVYGSSLRGFSIPL